VEFVLAYSGGLTGEVARLLNESAQAAILDKSEMIKLAHLEHAARSNAWSPALAGGAPPIPRGEAMGSWLGRVATRCRMSVVQLVEDYGLQIPMKASGAGWLLLPPLNTDVLQRLAGLQE
jgi:hypothetical protein